MRRFYLPLFLLLNTARVAAESFETLPAGHFNVMETEVGRWSADDGHARIQVGHGKTGNQSLRITGEGQRSVELELSSATEEGSVLVFHAERWTSRDPFEFHIDAKVGNTWLEIHNADDDVKVGGFLSEVRVSMPEGARTLRFRVTAPPDTGIMIDDVRIHRPGPARATAVETVQPVCPAFIRKDFNPILGFRVTVEGSEGTTPLESIEIGFGGTTHPEDIESFHIFAGEADPSAGPGALLVKGTVVADRITLSPQHRLAAGDHWFWISPVMKETASIDGRIDASVFQVRVGDHVLDPAQPSPEGSQRIGYAVRLPGDDDSKSYRIPGLAQTNAGTLIAVYDIRYRHSGDLPADIDVGVSRSSDGGQSWEPMRVAMDMGNDPKHHYDGVGDPAILVDPKSGRIWIAALWSHGDRAWNGSGPGMTPEETGQFLLAHSDDDGKTWSKAIHITEQVKDPAWRLFFNGPGAGIAMENGTLCFPAQYRAADGKPWSTIVVSKDQGKTWQVGAGVKSDTTEAQIVELPDGAIMINCRDNRGGSRTVAVTRDSGQTWEPHPSDRRALREPVCMASLLLWKHPRHGDLLFFSNPDSTRQRHDMTVKLSRDLGLTWKESDARLYDSRSCFGYSCLAVASAHHIGVLYEGKGSMLYLRLPLDEWFE